MPLEQTAVTLNLSLLFPRQIDVVVDALLGSLKTKQYAPIRCFSVSAKEQGTLTPSLAAVGRLLTDWPVLPVLTHSCPPDVIHDRPLLSVRETVENHSAATGIQA